MKIGIIGHEGFIGSKLLNIVDCENQFIPLRVRKGIVFEILGYTSDIEVIINAAGSADVRGSFQDPIRDFNNNVELVLNILEYLRKNATGVRFINLSSAAVYGDVTRLPVTIDTQKRPLSPYGFHKSMAEDILMEYNKIFQIPTLSLRVFSCYGNNNRKQALWDLCNKALESVGSTLEVYGNFNDTRDFIHVDDLVKQICLVASSKEMFDRGIVNIGNGTQTRISEIAKIVVDEFGCSRYEFTGDGFKGYPSQWQADIDDIKSLGYIQSISIEFGVKAYCNWFKQLKNE
jgi:UDP-glucose 4-epimerase